MYSEQSLFGQQRLEEGTIRQQKPVFLGLDTRMSGLTLFVTNIPFTTKV